MPDEETRAAFNHVPDHLDIPVNCAWGGYERMVEDGAFTWQLPFRQQPDHRWVSMMQTGVRAAFVSSAEAAERMIPARRGLIVNISVWAAQKHVGNAVYGIAKAATDKMTSDTAEDLRPHNVAVVSLYAGLVRTESVPAAVAEGWFTLANSESPEYGLRDIDGARPEPPGLESV